MNLKIRHDPILEQHKEYFYHLGFDIEVALSKSDHWLSTFFKEQDVPSIRRELQKRLDNGDLVLQCGDKCRYWSDVTGCPGHEEDML